MCQKNIFFSKRNPWTFEENKDLIENVLYKWLHGYIQLSNLSSALSMTFNFWHVNLTNYFAKIVNVWLGNQIFDFFCIRCQRQI